MMSVEKRCSLQIYNFLNKGCKEIKIEKSYFTYQECPRVEQKRITITVEYGCLFLQTQFSSK